MITNQINLLGSPIDPTFPFTQNVEKPKTARYHRPVRVVGGIGLEPTTFAMSTQRSNQLS